MRFSGLVRKLAFLLLTAAALFGAYLTSNLCIGNEHAAMSVAARHVPFAEPIGNAIVCGFGGVWDIPCPEIPAVPQAANIPELAGLDFSVRYLCPVYGETLHIECADEYLIGAAGVVIVIATALIAIILAFRCWGSRDRADLLRLIWSHAAAEVVAVLMLSQLMQVRLPYVWMGGLSGEMIGRSNVLGFTGDVIGYCVLLALVAIALTGTVVGGARLAVRT